MSVIKEIRRNAKGMLLDGIGASEHIDSSGEILDVKGCDIKDVEDGVATINYEHKDDTPTDTIGRLVYAKKIFGPEDCDDDRQLSYWKKSGVPYIYIIGELMDDDGHTGAKDAAAIVRHYHSRGLPIVARWSIEGSTLDKEKNSSRLKRSIFKRIALTLKPCNKDATSGVLFDPFSPKEKVKEPSSLKSIIDRVDKFEHPSYTKLGGAVEVECMPWIDDMAKAELSKEEELREKFKEILKNWDGEGDIRQFIKSALPEISDEFVEKFAGLVDNFQIKKHAGTDVIKQCATCKTMHTAQSWKALPHIGNQLSDDDTHNYTTELRNCGCGSTLGIEHATPKVLKSELVQKFEAMEQKFSALTKKIGEEVNPGSGGPEHVEFGGKKVKPGTATLHTAEGSHQMSLVGHDPDDQSFFAVPQEKVNGWTDQDLKKLPMGHPGLRINTYPEEQNTAPVVDAGVHGVNLTPDAHALVHGMELDPKKALSKKHIGTNSQAYWTATPSGKMVFVKPDVEADKFGDSEREGAFHNIAKEFFGLGHYVPTTATVRHPLTGQMHTITEAVEGDHSEQAAWDKKGNIPHKQEHINTLMKLGDSGELDKLGLMDTILNNEDRHHQNYLFTPEGSVKMLDHGLTFTHLPSGPDIEPDYLEKYDQLKQKQGHKEQPDAPLHPETAKWLSSLNPTNFKRSLRKNKVPLDHVNEAVRRLTAMQQEVATNPQGKKFDLYNSHLGIRKAPDGLPSPAPEVK